LQFASKATAQTAGSRLSFILIRNYMAPHGPNVRGSLQAAWPQQKPGGRMQCLCIRGHVFRA